MLKCINRSRPKYQHSVGTGFVGFDNAGTIKAQHAFYNRKKEEISTGVSEKHSNIVWIGTRLEIPCRHTCKLTNAGI